MAWKIASGNGPYEMYQDVKRAGGAIALLIKVHNLFCDMSLAFVVCLNSQITCQWKSTLQNIKQF